MLAFEGSAVDGGDVDRETGFDEAVIGIEELKVFDVVAGHDQDFRLAVMRLRFGFIGVFGDLGRHDTVLRCY